MCHCLYSCTSMSCICNAVQELQAWVFALCKLCQILLQKWCFSFALKMALVSTVCFTTVFMIRSSTISSCHVNNFCPDSCIRYLFANKRLASCVCDLCVHDELIACPIEHSLDKWTIPLHEMGKQQRNTENDTHSCTGNKTSNKIGLFNLFQRNGILFWYTYK